MILEEHFRWESVAAVVAGLAAAGCIISWPRFSLICLGLLALLLGLLGLSTLKVINLPALLAVFGGAGLIGLGRLVGAVDQHLKETRMQGDRRGTIVDQQPPATILEAARGTIRTTDRIEPRL